MQKKKIKIYVQVVVALFFVTINIIEFIRPITNWPVPVEIIDDIQNEMIASMNIWSKFGLFGAQFAFFTNWANWLFVGTIVYGWIFNKYISPYWKNALSTYLFITTIVFFTILAPFIQWDESVWIDYTWIHEHFIVTFAWFMYILISKTIRIKSWTKSVLITLSVPIVYFIFTFGIYIGYGFTIAVYPFFNFANIFSLNLSLPLSIFVSIVVIFIMILGFITTNFLFFEINFHQTIRRPKVRFWQTKKSENEQYN